MRRDREAEGHRDDAIRRAAERWLAMSPEARRAEVSRGLVRIFGHAADDDVERLVAGTDAYYRRVVEGRDD